MGSHPRVDVSAGAFVRYGASLAWFGLFALTAYPLLVVVAAVSYLALGVLFGITAPGMAFTVSTRTAVSAFTSLCVVLLAYAVDYAVVYRGLRSNLADA